MNAAPHTATIATLSKEQENSCGVRIAMDWVKACESILKRGLIPAKLSETITHLYIDGTLEEMGIVEQTLSQAGYERIRNKALDHATWKLSQGHAPATLVFFTKKKIEELKG